MHISRQATGCPRSHGNSENGILNESVDRVFTDYTLRLNAYVHIGWQAMGFPVSMETVKGSIGFLRT